MDKFLVCFCAIIPVLLVSPGSASSSDAAVPTTVEQEVCQTEEFDAQCGQGEVILMTSARYGRMAIGRCVKQNLGYLGCEKDVLGILHAMCSGRRKCTVRIPDPRLEATKACLGELKSYLQASYTCVQVVAPMNSCEGTPIRLTKPEGYLASYVALTMGCGLETSPWVLQAKEGQRINITLHDFGVSDRRPSYHYSESDLNCQEYAFLIDRPAGGKKVKLCPGTKRINPVYTSVNNTLEITMRSQSVMEDQTQFLIQYQFMGCSDFDAPIDMMYERTSAVTAVLRCPNTFQMFDLLCDGNTWKGHWENCTKVELVHGSEPERGSIAHVVVIMCLVALCVVVLTILIATLVFCIRRLNRRPNTQYYHYDYNGTCGTLVHQQNRDNMKQLHLDPKDLELQDRGEVYKPLVRVASHKSTNDCMLCNSRTHDRVYDSPPESFTYVAANNPRAFNNYIPKDSNIRNNLAASTLRSKTYHPGVHKKTVHVPPKCACTPYKCGCTAHQRGCTLMEETKPLNKSLDCDMMLDDDVGVPKHYVTKNCAETSVNNSLLNNTL